MWLSGRLAEVGGEPGWPGRNALGPSDFSCPAAGSGMGAGGMQRLQKEGDPRRGRRWRAHQEGERGATSAGALPLGLREKGPREAAHRSGDSWEREDEEMRKRKSLQRAREGPRLSAERSPPPVGSLCLVGRPGRAPGAERSPQGPQALLGKPPLQLPKEFPWGRNVHLSLGKKALWDRI